MTAEILVVIFLVFAASAAAGLGALILAALGSAGWLVIVALAVVGGALLLFALHRSDWKRDGLRDEWRPS